MRLIKEEDNIFNTITGTLMLAAKKDYSGHSSSGSFLLAGKNKEKMAQAIKELAQQINCSGDNIARAGNLYCGSCDNCVMIQKQEHPDVIWLEPTGDSSSIKIEDIRRIKKRMYLKSFQAIKKICIIRDAERLTPESANALLKMLEEPPQDALLFLLAESVSRLLPTVVSRCRLIPFLGPDFPAAKDDAQAAEFSERFFSEDISSPGGSFYEEIAGLERNEIENILERLSMMFRDMLILKLNINEDVLSGISPVFALKDLGNMFSPQAMELIIDDILRTKEYINKNANVKLAIGLLVKQIVKHRI